MTIHVPLREFKNKVSEFGRRAAAGERIIVTNRGEPQFELVATAEKRPRKGLNFEALRRWKKEHGITGPLVGPMSPDFDDPLPEDFLSTPTPPGFWEPKT